jgi:hypothetical protein
MPIVEARAHEMPAKAPDAASAATFTWTHSWGTGRYAWGQATLRNYDEFNSTPPAVAHAFVAGFTQAGIAHPPSGQPPGDWAVVSGDNMTEITYKLTATRCWARAMAVTEFLS